MTANQYPIFTKTPIIGVAAISTANTARDGTGTIGTVVTGGADGTRVNAIQVKAKVTTTAGMIRLFIADDAGTPNIHLWLEIAVTAITPSATVKAFEYSLLLPDESALLIPYGWSLRASTEKAEAFTVFARGGHFS